MAEFRQLREKLAGHRRQSDALAKESLLASEAVKKAERALADFERMDGADRKKERARLEAALEEAKANGDRSVSAREAIKRAERALEDFERTNSDELKKE